MFLFTDQVFWYSSAYVALCLGIDSSHSSAFPSYCICSIVFVWLSCSPHYHFDVQLRRNVITNFPSYLNQSVEKILPDISSELLRICPKPRTMLSRDGAKLRKGRSLR